MNRSIDICTLAELLRPINEFFEDIRRSEREKNVWQRFFTLLDYSVMMMLLAANTILTFLTFYDEIM